MDIFSKTRAGKRAAISRLDYVDAVMQVSEETCAALELIRQETKRDVDSLKARLEELEKVIEQAMEGKTDENL